MGSDSIDSVHGEFPVRHPWQWTLFLPEMGAVTMGIWLVTLLVLGNGGCS